MPIWYNDGRKGWRFWVGFSPLLRVNGRQPLATDGGFGFTYSCCCCYGQNRPQPKQEWLPVWPSELSQSQTWYHPLCFRKHQRWAPSAIFFLPAGSLLHSKNFYIIVAYWYSFVNLWFYVLHFPQCINRWHTPLQNDTITAGRDDALGLASPLCYDWISRQPLAMICSLYSEQWNKPLKAI